MILYNIILPIFNLSISLFLLRSIVLILDIHPGVIGIVPQLVLVELFCKALLPMSHYLMHLRLILLFQYFTLLTINEILDRLFSLHGCALVVIAVIPRTNIYILNWLLYWNRHQVFNVLNLLHWL
jgi:hypothetical protein